MPRIARSVMFFRVWSPAMAYVLGLWWADGCMRVKPHGAHEIEIASADLDHLRAVAQTVGIQFQWRRVRPGSETCAVTFCSKEMYQDLLALGGTPRKSRTIGFPQVPAELLPHYIRGVVDGDGTLSWNGDRPVVHIYSGSPQFLDDLAAAVAQATGIPAPIRAANRENWYIKWSTVRAQCLVAWLYVQHTGLALERKATIALRFLEWQPKRKPNSETITEEMRLHFSAYLDR